MPFFFDGVFIIEVSILKKITTIKRAQRALGRSPEEKVKGQGEAIILI